MSSRRSRPPSSKKKANARNERRRRRRRRKRAREREQGAARVFSPPRQITPPSTHTRTQPLATRPYTSSSSIRSKQATKKQKKEHTQTTKNTRRAGALARSFAADKNTSEPPSSPCVCFWQSLHPPIMRKDGLPDTRTTAHHSFFPWPCPACLRCLRKNTRTRESGRNPHKKTPKTIFGPRDFDPHAHAPSRCVAAAALFNAAASPPTPLPKTPTKKPFVFFRPPTRALYAK